MYYPSKLPFPDRDKSAALDLFGNLFVLSFMWLLCCLPIVTIPVACIALYDSMAHCVVGGEPDPVKRFWHTAKHELIRGVLMGIEWLVIGVVAVLSYFYVAALGEQMPIFKIYGYVYLASMVIPLSILVWIVPVQSRFGYKFWELHKVAGIFALNNLPQTLLMVAVLVGVTAFFLLFPIAFILLLIVPGILALMQTGTVEVAFAPYMPDDEEEENND